MLAYAYGFRVPKYAGDTQSLKAAIRSAHGNEIILCEKAPLERDEEAGREYYDCTYPQLRIKRCFGGYMIEWRSAWDDVKAAASGTVIKMPLMLQCAEQFMELLKASDSESKVKLPSCVEWE